MQVTKKAVEVKEKAILGVMARRQADLKKEAAALDMIRHEMKQLALLQQKEITEVMNKLEETDKDMIKKFLVSKNLGNRSVVLVPYNVNQARDARDAMVKRVYGDLFQWIVDRINNQRNEDKWDDVGELVRAAGYPPHAWIALGAGTYTAWGEKNYLRPRDEAVVIVYDDAKFPNGPDAAQVEALFHDKTAADGIVCVHQTFV